jgi:hypothetical protein
MKFILTSLLLAGTLAFAQAPAPSTKKPVAPAPVTATKPEAKPAPAPIAGGFVGNSNSKIYHKSDCKQGNKMKASNKVAFASKAEAEKAGYKACKSCKP